MKKNKKKVLSPPIYPLKWPEEIVISSDSELEMSMIQMEEKISLGCLNLTKCLHLMLHT